MAAKTGSLSINSENIFPIIKKWLYSDHDIFYRELISNGCDAITKLKKLALMGEYEEPGETEYKIQVTVNSEDKTITVELEHRSTHPLYGQVVRSTSKLKAHDEHNDAHIGDLVSIMETRPLSKTKRWRLESIIERAK